jgi:hypothetical protein
MKFLIVIMFICMKMIFKISLKYNQFKNIILMVIIIRKFLFFLNFYITVNLHINISLIYLNFLKGIFLISSKLIVIIDEIMVTKFTSINPNKYYKIN